MGMAGGLAGRGGGERGRGGGREWNSKVRDEEATGKKGCNPWREGGCVRVGGGWVDGSVGVCGGAVTLGGAQQGGVDAESGRQGAQGAGGAKGGQVSRGWWRAMGARTLWWRCSWVRRWQGCRGGGGGNGRVQVRSEEESCWDAGQEGRAGGAGAWGVQDSGHWQCGWGTGVVKKGRVKAKRVLRRVSGRGGGAGWWVGFDNGRLRLWRRRCCNWGRVRGCCHCRSPSCCCCRRWRNTGGSNTPRRWRRRRCMAPPRPRTLAARMGAAPGSPAGVGAWHRSLHACTGGSRGARASVHVRTRAQPHARGWHATHTRTPPRSAPRVQHARLTVVIQLAAPRSLRLLLVARRGQERAAAAAPHQRDAQHQNSPHEHRACVPYDGWRCGGQGSSSGERLASSGGARAMRHGTCCSAGGASALSPTPPAHRRTLAAPG